MQNWICDATVNGVSISLLPDVGETRDMTQDRAWFIAGALSQRLRQQQDQQQQQQTQTQTWEAAAASALPGVECEARRAVWSGHAGCKWNNT